MVDLAVPRDIEPEVGELERRVPLHRRRSRRDRARRQRVAAGGGRAGRSDHRNARAEFHALARRAQHRAGDPPLHTQADALRRAEVERARKMLARGDDPAAVLEALSQSLTNKLLHGPTHALNRASSENRDHAHRPDERLLQALRFDGALAAQPPPQLVRATPLAARAVLPVPAASRGRFPSRTSSAGARSDTRPMKTSMQRKLDQLATRLAELNDLLSREDVTANSTTTASSRASTPRSGRSSSTTRSGARR